MIDILEWMLPDQAWQITHHYTDIAAGGHPIFTVYVAPNQIWQMKSDKGYPWDMNTFDDNFVYQSITEVSWTDPKTFKIFSSKNWPGSNGGIVWAPRHIEEYNSTNPVITQDPNFRLYSNCTSFTDHKLGTAVTTFWTGPEEINFEGDLGLQDALIQRYLWETNMEVFYYVKGLGLVQWQLYNLVGGQYVLNKTSAFNTLVTGKCAQPVFPCGVPVITSTELTAKEITIKREKEITIKGA